MVAAPAAAPVTVTSTLEAMWADVGSPVIIAALSSAVPAIGFIFKIPIVGNFLTWLINRTMDKLIVAGVIAVKVGIISYMSTQAKAKWDAELQILNQVHAAGGTLTPQQQTDYDAALQNLVKSNSGVVRA